MNKKITPTDPKKEQELGRIALWLDVPDLHWLSTYCGCPSDAAEEQRERCARIRFRENAALHKAGLAKVAPHLTVVRYTTEQ